MRRRQFLSVFTALVPAQFFRALSFPSFAEGVPDGALSLAVRRVGEAYLRQRPGEAGREILLRNIGINWRGTGTPLDLTEIFRSQIRADFVAGRTILLDGWMLSETECRLCALQVVA